MIRSMLRFADAVAFAVAVTIFVAWADSAVTFVFFLILILILYRPRRAPRAPRDFRPHISICPSCQWRGDRRMWEAQAKRKAEREAEQERLIHPKSQRVFTDEERVADTARRERARLEAQRRHGVTNIEKGEPR